MSLPSNTIPTPPTASCPLVVVGLVILFLNGLPLVPRFHYTSKFLYAMGLFLLPVFLCTRPHFGSTVSFVLLDDSLLGSVF